MLVQIDKFLSNLYESDFCRWNDGLSFNLFAGEAFLIPLTILNIVLIVFALRRRSRGLLIVGFGGLLNLVERFLFGAVCDYILIPGVVAFNINDILIFVGCLIYLYDEFKNRDTVEDKPEKVGI